MRPKIYDFNKEKNYSNKEQNKINEEENKLNGKENDFNKEENKLNEEKDWNKSILKYDNEEENYWIYKLTNEVKKKIKHYNCTLGGLEKLYSTEIFEGVPNLIELIHRCEDYKRKNGDNFTLYIRRKNC